MPTTIITDGSMDKLVDAPNVVLPKRSIFIDRAARFDALGNSEMLGGYMRLMGHVCRAQATAFAARHATVIDAKALENSRNYGMPPLSAHVFPRGDAWLADLQDIVNAVLTQESVLTEELKASLGSLKKAIGSDPASVDSCADRLIAGDPLPEDGAWYPFVGAALQVIFTRMASTIEPADVNACDIATVCPCCGMRPTGSVIRLDPDRQNYRYLACSLCMTEWNMGRVKCSSCESEKSVGYLIIDEEGRSASDAAVRAETCDECKTYLKIYVQEKAPMVDVIADDLNTLALDMLVHEKGYARTGPNFLFYPGHE
jgi:FdhE protein